MLSQNFLPADQLGLTEKQRDAMIVFLGMCERGEIVHAGHEDYSIPKGEHRFNLNTWWDNEEIDPLRRECGTVGCIGGWIDFICGVRTLDERLTISILNSSPAESELRGLFFPGMDFDWKEVTVAQAGLAVRNYLTLGQAKWEEILS